MPDRLEGGFAHLVVQVDALRWGKAAATVFCVRGIGCGAESIGCALTMSSRVSPAGVPGGAWTLQPFAKLRGS